MISEDLYRELKAENVRIAARVNRAWAAPVAWVEDRSYATPDGIPYVLPVVASRMVGGLVPGLETPPFRGFA